jgi:hypothetical protein
VCGPCDDGNPCTIDDCDFEAGVCVSIPDDREGCSDGTFCNDAKTCVGATCESPSNPCAGLVCDEVDAVCVGCVDDEDCPPVETDRGMCVPRPMAERCDMTGTRDVLFNVSECMEGTCEVVGTMLAAEPCTLPSTDGAICLVGTMTVWGPCTPPCGNTRSRIGTTDVLRCAEGVCSEPGFAMMSMTCAPLTCSDGGTCTTSEVNCRDMVDDDCDTRTDCADTDCIAMCRDGGTCTAEICTDAMDNDCDTMTDCDDADCATAPGCV